MAETNLIMEHFQNPRNAGPMEAPEAVGSAGSPGEGGQVVLHFRFDGERIAETRFQTFGCGYAIAVCSYLTEWLTGRLVSEACELRARELSDMLGGMPEEKLFCAELALEALHHALAARE